jgi:hypothetical protein
VKASSNFIYILAVFLVSCGHPLRTEAQAEASKTADLFSAVAPAPHSREANDAARFLAGLPGLEGSPFLAMEQQEAWKLHRRELDRMWGKIGTETLPAMRQFQSSELNTAGIRNSVIFYPFSGPDSLIVNVFFPANSIYALVGLEPPGSLPTAQQFARKNLALTLTAERRTVSDVLGKSFFVTRQMDRQFRGQVTDGLFQPLVHLLVRTGHTIVGYRAVRLDENGRVVERDAAAGKVPNRGVEIDFSSEGSTEIHRLFYFSLNLADDRLKDNSSFAAFVNGLKGMTTYLKATSYMTHHKEFSIIRDMVLNGSSAVLQDDSGIPYHCFEPAAWHIQLFGEYTRPYGSFRYMEEKDLREAYQTAHPKPLEFRIGYGFSKAPSNLLFATKVQPVTSARR